MTTPASRRTRSLLRISALLIGLAVMLWLPVEDSSLVGVALLSAAVCAWIAARSLAGVPIEKEAAVKRHVWVGVLAGLAVTPVALLLMVFKSGLHGHSGPDFTLDQFRAVLLRAPVWVLIGALLGLGSGLIRAARRR